MALPARDGRWGRPSSGRQRRLKPLMISIAAASVLVCEVDPSLHFVHRAFDEMHGSLAMAAFVGRRLQGRRER
jgi:hypothetical protein